MTLAGKRTAELLALGMIGDGVLALLRPRGHVGLWREGPRAWEALIEPFARRPMLTRAAGIAGIAAGLWLASRSERNAAAG